MGNKQVQSTVVVSVEVPQKARDIFTSLFTYTTIEHILKWLNILLQRYMLNNVQGSFNYNTQDMEVT